VAGRGIRVVAGGESVMARGEKITPGPVHLRTASVRIPWSVVLLGWVGRTLGKGLGRMLGQPVLWVALTLYLVGYWLAVTVGPWPFVTAALAVTGALVGWRQAHRSSFLRWFGWPVRSAWRQRLVYRRGWQPAMVTCNLAVRVSGREYLPKLIRVSSTRSVDRVTVRMLPGQVADDYSEVADRLAQTFDASDCRVRTDPRHRDRLILWFLVDDPLTEPVAPYEPGDPDLAALPVARREDGLTYHLKLLGSHLLLVAATGAGKSNAIWAIIQALAQGVASGVVQLWVCDPKGGMELAPGQQMFTQFCHGATTDQEHERAAHEHAYAELLEKAVLVMRERQARLRGVTRLHEPTTDEPLIVVIVDELAALTAYMTHREAKKRISAALSLLLSQGRAVGVLLVAALQDPRKDVLPARDLFPTRIALRLTEPEQVDMVLGARRRGARCDRIPESLPGVGYVTLDGVAEPIRVRFAHVTDRHITDLASRYAPSVDPADAAEPPLRLVPGGTG
ncbi:MAG: FtsK/SpoIIIE domain-containing protein, partial [Nocardioidaceae bacterium]